MNIEYERANGYLTTDQEELIEKVTKRFCLDKLECCDTPMDKCLFLDYNYEVFTSSYCQLFRPEFFFGMFQCEVCTC